MAYSKLFCSHRLMSCVFIFVCALTVNTSLAAMQTVQPAPDRNPQNSPTLSPSDRIQPTADPTTFGTPGTKSAAGPSSLQESVTNPFPNNVADLPPAPSVSETQKVDDFVEQLKTAREDLAKQKLEFEKQKTASSAPVDLEESTKQFYDQAFEKPFDDGGWKDVSEEKFTTRIGGRILMDSIHWLDDTELGDQPDGIQFRQLRLSAEGTGYGVYSYKLELEFSQDEAFTFGSLGSVFVKDAWVGMTDVPLLGHVRAGHVKVPFGFEQAQDQTNLTFLERSTLDNQNGFVPGRELGAAYYTHNDDQSVSISGGVFFDGLNETSKQNQGDGQGFLSSLRMTWLPYFDEPSNGRYLVHAGLGMLYAQPQRDIVRFFGQAGSIQTLPIVDTFVISAENYTIVNPEFALNAGSVSLQGEFFWASVDDNVSGNRHMQSAYVSASWRLTGEHRNYNRQFATFGGVTPHENAWLLPGSAGWGAWEVATRYTWVDLNDSPNSAQYDELTVGLNWYLNPTTRFQTNWVHPVTAGGVLGRTASDLLTMRLGIHF